MVTTRRQSGKLPPPLFTASANEVKDLEEEDDFGGYESPRTDTTDSDDDFAAKPSGELQSVGCSSVDIDYSAASKGRRPSKRAKIDGTSSKKTAKSKKNGSDLSCIVDMPLDILFEVCRVEFCSRSSHYMIFSCRYLDMLRRETYSTCHERT